MMKDINDFLTQRSLQTKSRRPSPVPREDESAPLQSQEMPREVSRQAPRKWVTVVCLLSCILAVLASIGCFLAAQECMWNCMGYCEAAYRCDYWEAYHYTGRYQYYWDRAERRGIASQAWACGGTLAFTFGAYLLVTFIRRVKRGHR